jgi:hypothetical protein
MWTVALLEGDFVVVDYGKGGAYFASARRIDGASRKRIIPRGCAIRAHGFLFAFSLDGRGGLETVCRVRKDLPLLVLDVLMLVFQPAHNEE